VYLLIKKQKTMKKHLLILILALPIFMWQGVSGQEYNKVIQENLTWDVLSANATLNPFCNFTGGNRLFILGDTTIQGNEYKIINGIRVATTELGPFCPPFHVSYDTVFRIGYIREDTIAKKVFTYDIDFGDALLYDFNLAVGDTLFSFFNFCDNLIIDSIGTINLLNSDNRNIFYLNNGEFYIEGVGGSQGLNNPLCQGIGFWSEPYCVLKDGVAIFNFSSNSSNCFQVLAIEKFQDNQDFIIYPNPATDQIIIKNENYDNSVVTIEIIDLTGKVLIKETQNSSSHRICLQKLQSGVYFARISTPKNTSIQKFLIIK